MSKEWEIELLPHKEEWEVNLLSVSEYKLPIASPDQLGGVQPVTKTESMTQAVGVDKNGALWVDVGEDVDLSDYAQKSELPTKVSQLQNDVGYAKTADIPTKPEDIGAAGLNLHVIYDSGIGSIMYYAPDNSNGNVIDYEQAMQIPSPTFDNRSVLYAICNYAQTVVLPNAVEKTKQINAKRLMQDLAVLVDAGLVVKNRQYNFYVSTKVYSKENLPNILDDFDYIGISVLSNGICQVKNLRRHDRGGYNYTIIQADGTISFDFNVLTDKTLSVTNLAADAEVVGKELANKIDKTEVVLRNEVEETDAIELAAKMGLVSPVAAEDGSIYTDENGVLYTL